MREIKFRGNSVLDNQLIYGYGYYIDQSENKFILVDDKLGNMRPVEVRCIDQYTGLKDKNGKEIYEGDYVKGEYETNLNTWKPYLPLAVEWEKDGAGFNIRGWDRIEIIGNIYENPELLKY